MVRIAVGIVAGVAFLAGMVWVMPQYLEAGPRLGDCAFVVQFRGHQYHGSSARRMPSLGPSLGPAVQPACTDVVPVDPTVGSTTLEVFAIPGVDPDVAVMTPTAVLVRVEHRGPPGALQTILTAPDCRDALTLTGQVRDIDRTPLHPSAAPTMVRLQVAEGTLLERGRWAWVEVEIDVPPGIPGIALLTPEADMVTVSTRCAAGRFRAVTIELR